MLLYVSYLRYGDYEMQELLKAVSDAVESKVFSIEVLQNIAELRKQATEQEDVIKKQNVRIEELRINVNEVDQRLNRANESIKLYKAREDEITKRETDMTKLECTVEMNKALAAQSKDYVGMIFRNHNLMTSVQDHLVIPGVSGSQFNQNGTPSYSVPIVRNYNESKV